MNVLGTAEQIQVVVDENIIPILIGMASPDVEFDIRKEVYWALANAASGSTRRQVIYTRTHIKETCMYTLLFLIGGVSC